MLILSRKKDERIVVSFGDEEVLITVVELRGDHVRIGIDAAPHVSIDRHEIFDRKRGVARPQK